MFQLYFDSIKNLVMKYTSSIFLEMFLTYKVCNYENNCEIISICMLQVCFDSIKNLLQVFFERVFEMHF